MPFLTIDHVNDNGATDRREACHDIRFNNLDCWPISEEYRVLCFNCNSGRHVNGGVCPHEEERREVGGWPYGPEATE